MRKAIPALIGAFGAMLVFVWGVVLITHAYDIGVVVIEHPSVMLLILATVIELGVLGLWTFIQSGWSE